jgi:hypothetical protein
METYIDELETEKMSMASLNRIIWAFVTINLTSRWEWEISSQSQQIKWLHGIQNDTSSFLCANCVSSKILLRSDVWIVIIFYVKSVVIIMFNIKRQEIIKSKDTNTMPLLAKTSMVLQNISFKASECAFISRFVWLPCFIYLLCYVFTDSIVFSISGIAKA